jgi:hypothetical protein
MARTVFSSLTLTARAGAVVLLSAVLATAAAFLLPGCYSYAVQIAVRPPGGVLDPMREPEIARAASIVESSAREFGLLPSTNLERFREAWAKDEDDPYRVLDVFGREPEQQTQGASVLLVAAVEE